MSDPNSLPQANPQAAHYDRILSDYDRHYYDRHSTEYRERFILEPLLAGIDLHGLRVADFASGSGYTSAYLAERYPGIQLTGFDVSAEACAGYQNRMGRPCFQFDLTRRQAVPGGFDAGIIMGGLHHCVADLPATFANIHAMLNPGGILLMFEPNRQYALQFAREFWYKRDRYFDAANEQALAHDELVELAGGGFVPETVRYFGGPAFFLVYNSLLFRMPAGIKAASSRVLLGLEVLHSHLPGRRLHSSFTARWRRT
jgi:SAM-dependent methyltransferase